MDNLFSLNKELIALSHSVLRHYRRGSLFLASKALRKLLASMNDFLSELSSINDNNTLSGFILCLNELLSAQENNDNVLIADIIEASLIPSLNELLQNIIVANPNITSSDMYAENIDMLKKSDFKTAHNAASLIPHADNTSVYSKLADATYTLEPSAAGVNTLKYTSKARSFYLHSNNNPFLESDNWAESCGDDECFNYTVFGFGLGYHIRALLEHDRRYEITVIEPDINVLSLAFTYCELADILSNPRLHLSVTDDLKAISETLQKSDTKLLVYYPSMEALKENALKSALKQYYIKLDSANSQLKYLKWNFYYNQKLKDLSVDSIKEAFTDKTVVLLAGGPSLEASLDIVKEMSDDNSCVLLSVGTSYRGLVKKGIIPDFVIMTDPQDHMFVQVRDIPKTNASLLYLSTASNKAVCEFKGDRYIIYQQGFDEAEKYADANKLTLFETGGSVSTTAVDIALRFNCQKLIMLGLDLGYPHGRLHSFTNEKSNDAGSALIEVPAVPGGTILTTNVLSIYRKWIENRISQTNNNIPVINISDGAYINNAKNLTINKAKSVV